jgi:hypothetical protein
MTFTHLVVEVLGAHVVVVVQRFLVVEHKVQCNRRDTQLFQQFNGQIAGGVGNDYVVVHGGISFIQIEIVLPVGAGTSSAVSSVTGQVG